MIDYSSLGRPPRRRRGRAVIAAVAAVLVLGGLAVVALGHLGSGVAATKPSHHQETQPAPIHQAGELTLGACVDPTASIVSSFAVEIRRDLAQAVAGLAPAPGRLPTNTVSGGGPVTQPQAGVDLTVREVTTNSYSSVLGRYTTTVTVPPVPGLAYPRPSPSARDYLQRLRAWSAGYAAVATARQAARKAAAPGAAAIARMHLDRAGWSGISACVSALLTTVPPGGRHTYLLASDLQQNVAPQLIGSFHGAPMVIIQTCDTGNVAFCQGLLRRFTRWMHQLHVGPITAVRPELAATAIRQWIRTGEVTP